MLKNFYHLKQLNLDSVPEGRERIRAKDTLDFVVGKYLKLIYLCLFQTGASAQLLTDCQKYAFYYSVCQVESQQLEALPLE